MGWKWGCQPSSCPCSQNVTHCRKGICGGHVCFQESIPAVPFWNSNHPIPKRSLRFLRAAVRSTISTLRYGCIMPIPSLQLQKKVEKACLMQRSRGFGWKWGCQPFSCRCSQNVTQWQTRFGRHICLRPRHPFPPFLFGKYNLNFYHKLEVPESSTLHQLCTMVASCPSLRCNCRKKTRLMQTIRGCGHGVVVSKICFNAVIVRALSCSI